MNVAASQGSGSAKNDGAAMRPDKTSSVIHCRQIGSRALKHKTEYCSASHLCLHSTNPELIEEKLTCDKSPVTTASGSPQPTLISLAVSCKNLIASSPKLAGSENFTSSTGCKTFRVPGSRPPSSPPAPR